MCKEYVLFEELLAYHCAPALKGYKMANMFHVTRQQFPNAEQIVLDYNKKFKEKGLTFRIMQAEQPRITFYVYSKEKFFETLKQVEIKTFLKQLGYPVSSPSACLDFLETRMKESTYPHEIGLFLGYPLEDVLGFINNKTCYCIGAWKVYDQKNVTRSKSLFTLFNILRDQLIKAVDNGYPIEQIV